MTTKAMRKWRPVAANWLQGACIRANRRDMLEQAEKIAAAKNRVEEDASWTVQDVLAVALYGGLCEMLDRAEQVLKYTPEEIEAYRQRMRGYRGCTAKEVPAS